MRIKRPSFTIFSTADQISPVSIGILCILCVSFLTPLVARNAPNIVLIGLMGLFVVSVYPRLFTMKKNEKLLLGVLAVAMLIQTLYKVFGKSTAELYYYFNTVQFYFFLCAAMVLYASLSKNQVKFILFIIVGIVFINLLQNIYLFFVHGPSAYAILFRTDKYGANAFNTSNVTAIMFLSGTGLFCALNCNDLRRKVRLLLLTVLGFVFVAFIAQRMIAILFSIVMCATLLLLNVKTFPGKNLSRKQKLIVGLIVVAVLLVILINWREILLWIGEVSGSRRLYNRMKQIVKFLSSGDIQAAGGSLTVRYNLIKTSLDTFVSSVQNFLLGAGDHRATNEIIGNHSQFLDDLARYGVLFGTVMFTLFGGALHMAKKMCLVSNSSKRLNYQILTILGIFVLRGFVGNMMDPSIAISIFIVLPLSVRLLQPKTNKKQRPCLGGEQPMIISTCSFGSSGSSAVSDYLCECEGVQVMDKLEFNITSAVDGLTDLEYHLMLKNPRQSNSIYAIQRFKKLMMGKAKGLEKRTGIPAERVIEITDEFLDRITQVKYVGFSPRIDKGTGRWLRVRVGDSFIRNRIIRTLERKGIIKENVDFFPLDTVRMAIHPENFYKEAQNFLKTLLIEMGADFDQKIVLDQAFSGSDPSQSFPFYENAYAIVVDRDPRDMYIFAKKVLLSKGRFMPSDTVDNFINYYRLLRSNDAYREENDRILRLHFEDMVYNYDETVKRIDRFLNVKNVSPKSVFVPEMSVANTNLIRKFPEFTEDIKKIEQELAEFLFDFNKYPAMDNGGKMFFGKSPLNKKK